MGGKARGGRKGEREGKHLHMEIHYDTRR